MDDADIDAALEVGLDQCLRQLQKSNPSLLLTASQLRKAERDARYVPAVSSAIASVLSRSVSLDKASLTARVRKWGNNSGGNVVSQVLSDENSTAEAENEEEEEDGDSQSQGRQVRPNQQQIEELGALIEGQLRLSLASGGKPKKKAEKADDDESNHDETDEETELQFVDLNALTTERNETQASERSTQETFDLASAHHDEDDFDDGWI